MIDIEEIQANSALALASGDITPEVRYMLIEALQEIRELRHEKKRVITFLNTLGNRKDMKKRTTQILKELT